VGKVVKLKDANGNWEDGWKVVSASEPKPAKFIEGHERDYLKNRKASDI
jgi:hypothetical protein